MRRTLSTLCSIPVVVGMALTLKPTLHTSEEGLEHIARQEGCVRCRYADGIGITTIGVGHRIASGVPVSLYDVEVAKLYAYDIERAEKCVIDRFDGHYMPQSVFDSTVSLVFNVGCSGTAINPKTKRKTSIARSAEAGDWAGVCYHMGDFIFAGGRPILRTRRSADQELCIKDVPNAGLYSTQ